MLMKRQSNSLFYPAISYYMSICTICKDVLYIPTSLSCTHTFCLLCIKNHLFNRSFCPLCNTQIHISELKIKKGAYESRLCKYERKLCFVNKKFICEIDRVSLLKSDETNDRVDIHLSQSTVEQPNSKQPVKSKKLPEIKPFIFCKLTDAKLKKMCKEYNLRRGSKQEMVERLKDFYLLYTVERETVNPLSLYGISNLVNKKVHKKEVNIEAITKKHIANINEIRKKFIMLYEKIKKQ